MAARRGDWRTTPMPGDPPPVELPYRAEFSAQEHARIVTGLVPRAMEDKWFVFAEGDRVFFHRSSTGYCVYEVDLEARGDGAAVVRARCNAHPEQFRWPDAAWATAQLDFLIRRLLLGQRGEPPVPPGIAPQDASLARHHLYGRGDATPPRPDGT